MELDCKPRTTLNELRSILTGATYVDNAARLLVDRLSSEIELLQSYGKDILTGLPTRSVAEDKIAELENTRTRVGDSRSYAVVFVDLDGLKSTNDKYGHGIGDTLIKTMGEAIRKTSRPMDFACRWGGDEFLVILDSPHPASAVKSQVDRIKKLYTGAVNSDGRVPLRALLAGAQASYGTAIVQEGESFHQTIERADSEMYREKRAKGASNGVR